jgi:hypothetical protein
MPRIAVLVALIGWWALPATAAVVVVDWTLPDRRVDGTTLAPADLAHTEVEYAACSSDDQLTAPTTRRAVPAPATETTLEEVPPGPLCVRARVVDNEGAESAYTAVARVMIPSGAAPGAPINLRVEWVESPPPGEPPPPSAQAAVVGRPLTAGGFTATNRVYRRLSSGAGEFIGDAAVGDACDCTDGFQAAWNAGPGTYCSVTGRTNLTRTTYVALGAPFPTNAWTRCDVQQLEAP